MVPFDWQCPSCAQHLVVTKENIHTSFEGLYVGGPASQGKLGLKIIAIRCTSPSCGNTMIGVSIHPAKISNNGYFQESGDAIQYWRLRPESLARPQPEYIPQALREDYTEACIIRDKSPKASATLARRCLQGMIRDFCGISKTRLIDEIKELKKQADSGSAPKGVEIETIEAIDAVRRVGNIGAHMERDIDLIVDVDPGEAQALIELIEMLFDEWYVARHVRQERLAKVKLIAAEKAASIETSKAAIAQQTLARISDQSGDA